MKCPYCKLEQRPIKIYHTSDNVSSSGFSCDFHDNKSGFMVFKNLLACKNCGGIFLDLNSIKE